jgi:23S rRNA (cytidine2498-2'-O)-methyltransferase
MTLDAMPRPEFIFLTCQAGAGDALKQEIARLWPDLRLAFSRPGFLTFKLPAEHALHKQLELRSVFARCGGYALGRVQGTDRAQMAAEVWNLSEDWPVRALHVWQRDRAAPGDFDFTPGVSQLADEVEAAVRAAAADPKIQSSSGRRPAGRGQMVLDCIVVEPDLWWVGAHPAASLGARWPGGVIPIELPEDAVSRAYLKMEEAIRWSRLPIKEGDVCVEIGSAPGGASQALLARGLVVNGIDPAEMDAVVLADPNFNHLKMRARDLPRREFRGVRWLTADMNVAPQFTLDALESIVTHEEVHVRGMLITLKLLEWELAEQIPEHLDRIRSWGYRDVRGRQLAHNRQEICVAAIKHRSLRRMDARRRPRKNRSRS